MSQPETKPVSDDLLHESFTPERAEVARKNLIDLRRRVANDEAVPVEELAAGIREIRIMFGKEAQTVLAAKAAKAAKKPSAAALKKEAVKIDVDNLLGSILG